jgi:hypothetical protein
MRTLFKDIDAIAASRHPMDAAGTARPRVRKPGASDAISLVGQIKLSNGSGKTISCEGSHFGAGSGSVPCDGGREAAVEAALSWNPSPGRFLTQKKGERGTLAAGYGAHKKNRGRGQGKVT